MLHRWRLCNVMQTRLMSVSYLTTALPSSRTTTGKRPDEVVGGAGSKSPTKVLPNPPKSIDSLIITPKELTDKFRSDSYTKPDGKILSASQKLFNNTKPSLEWTLADYNEIPDVKESLLAKDDTKFKRKYPILPEVLFLGHTNSGKSSLINNLLLSSLDAKTKGGVTEYAFVSNRAGYTKTMNCYRVSNKFRLVDSPGYGMFGKEEQGQMVVDYIHRRRVLRRAFLLVDSSEGFREEDIQIMDLLVDEGTPFEIIFTKVDLVIAKFMKKHNVESKKVTHLKNRHQNAEAVTKANEDIINYFIKTIKQADLYNLSTFPRILFNNAVANKMITKRFGYKEIRTTIVESCGLS